MQLRCNQRYLLGLLFLFGALGAAAELVLLEHYEDRWQLVPLVLVGMSLAALAWRGLRPSPLAVRVFRLTMLLFVASGFVGTWQHYQANVEFVREVYPSMSGLKLLWSALKGATPTLAPGTMMLLGLLGLLHTSEPKERRDETA